jgi:hypothetical protein
MEPKDRAEELLNSLKTGKQVYDAFTTNFRRQYLIGGRTIETWEKEFKIKLPEALDPPNCKVIDIQLLKLHEQATFYKALADSALGVLERGEESLYNDRITAYVNEHRTSTDKDKARLPAAATLETLAKAELGDVEGAVAAAKVSANFWKEILNHLAFCRKVLDNASISSGIEAKLINSANSTIYKD